MGATSGPGAAVNMVKSGGWLPPAGRHSPATHMKGSVVDAQRWRVLGLLVPLNSKNAETGMRQRLLLAKLRPSDLKLNTGDAPASAGANPQRIAANSTDVFRGYDAGGLVSGW
jgi:hypothetical protein